MCDLIRNVLVGHRPTCENETTLRWYGLKNNYQITIRKHYSDEKGSTI